MSRNGSIRSMRHDLAKRHDYSDIPAADLARDMAAADALQKYEGDTRWALNALGYPVNKQTKPADVRRIAIKVFNPNVLRMLNDRFGDLQEQKSKLISRQVRIARFGKNEDATKAFQALARVAGWNAAVKLDLNAKSVNIHSIMKNPEILEDALSRLSHEPGEPKALTDAKSLRDYREEEMDAIDGDAD